MYLEVGDSDHSNKPRIITVQDASFLTSLYLLIIIHAVELQANK